MALNTVSSDRLSTNVKTSNLGTELKKKVGQSKNLIINGAMQVAQRGTSFTTNDSFSVDRFQNQYSGVDIGPTFAQVDVASGTSPYTNGFRKALKITNADQSSGAGSNDMMAIVYKFESQDIANSGWNYLSNSSYITLSYWVKSSIAQNFYGRFQSNDGTSQNYPFETGSLSADTWTKITKTIPGNSNLQFDNDVNNGLFLELSTFRGTDKTGSIALDAWNAYGSGTTRTPDQTSTWYTTNGATFEITGVQIEVGSQATAFEHRTAGDELALCERYCIELIRGQQYVGTCMLYTSSTHTAAMVWKTTMRAAPTMVANSGGDYYITYRNAGSVSYNALAGTSLVSRNGGSVYTTSGSGTQGHAGAIAGANASTLVYLDAEL